MRPESRQVLRRVLRVVRWLLLVTVLIAVGAFAWGWYTVFRPFPATLETAREITDLPFPPDTTVVGMRATKIPWPDIHARLTMPAEAFDLWREQLPFVLTREEETVELASKWLQWPGGEDARSPDWWRPEDLQDPLAAFDGYPSAEAPPDDPFPAHHVRILAGQRPDGTVDIYLYDLVD